MDILLRFGADLNSTDALGQSTLHIAVMNGHLSLVASILRRGGPDSPGEAEVNLDAIDKKGNSALIWAAAVGDDARCVMGNKMWFQIAGKLLPTTQASQWI